MQVNDIKRQIQAKRLDNFYVFTGEEIEVQRIYINKISEVTNKPIRRIEQVKEAFNKRASLLKVSYLFVCRDDTDFWKSATSVETVNELLGDNMLILKMTEIDKRSKSCKLYSNQITEFKVLEADVLYKYAQQQCPLSDDRIYDLIDRCEQNYKRLILEADKINRYARACDISVDEAFDKLIEEGSIHRPPKNVMFAYVNAMLRADIGKAFDLLEECKALGESPLRIISVLYSNFKRVLQVQVCESRDICGTTGLTPQDVRIARQTVGCWKSEDLLFFLNTLQALEQKIKVGEVEEEKALDLLMVLIL